MYSKFLLNELLPQMCLAFSVDYANVSAPPVQHLIESWRMRGKFILSLCCICCFQSQIEEYCWTSGLSFSKYRLKGCEFPGCIQSTSVAHFFEYWLSACGILRYMSPSSIS